MCRRCEAGNGGVARARPRPASAAPAGEAARRSRRTQRGRSVPYCRGASSSDQVPCSADIREVLAQLALEERLGSAPLAHDLVTSRRGRQCCASVSLVITTLQYAPTLEHAPIQGSARRVHAERTQHDHLDDERTRRRASPRSSRPRAQHMASRRLHRTRRRRANGRSAACADSTASPAGSLDAPVAFAMMNVRGSAATLCAEQRLDVLNLLNRTEAALGSRGHRRGPSTHRRARLARRTLAHAIDDGVLAKYAVLATARSTPRSRCAAAASTTEPARDTS